MGTKCNRYKARFLARCTHCAQQQCFWQHSIPGHSAGNRLAHPRCTVHDGKHVPHCLCRSGCEERDLDWWALTIRATSIGRNQQQMPG